MKKNLLKTIKSVSLCSLAWISTKSIAQCPTPTSVTATPSIICSGSTTSLNATAAGASINWYTVPSGGSSLGSSLSGANFTIAPTTNTFYAESFILGGALTQTFNYTGSLQTFTVPGGVSAVTIVAKGAQGTAGTSQPGNGGAASGVMPVTPGQTLHVYVGGQNGYNGGGLGVAPGGNGGGASDVRVLPGAVSDRVIVAGGGGGGGATNPSAPGGAGGGGVAGVNYVGGGGGIGANGQGPPVGGVNGGLNGGAGGIGNGSNNGGAGGGGGFNSGGLGGANPGYISGNSGSLALGGNAGGPTGPGGGGGGYYGGGGASGGLNSNAGGGGGSSFTGTLTSPSFSSGIQTGNGQVLIYYSSTACVSATRTAVSFTINPSPTITVNSGSICSGNSFTMSPSGAASYTYQGGNAVVSPTANTNYTVVGTSSLGCNSAPVTSSVTVNALPLPTVSVNSGSICSGSSFTMVPSGANTYTFQGGNAVVSPTANATYTVVGTNSAGCVSATFATSSITVAAAPSVSVSGTPSICVGQSATLTANGANTYSWNTGASTSSVVVNPTVTTSYTVTGTSSVTGCSGTTTVSLLVSPCTSINENAGVFTGLNLYPNPNTGVFNIELPVSAELIIQNSVGELIYTENLNAGNAAINIQGLSNGLYFIQLKNKDSKATYKVIKQ